MNSIHDMGGMEGFGPINPEENEPYFHHEWEKRVFGIFFSLFAAGKLNIDMIRFAMERMGNQHYLESSYYEHWLSAFVTLCDEGGVVSRDELEARMTTIAQEVS